MGTMRFVILAVLLTACGNDVKKTAEEKPTQTFFCDAETVENGEYAGTNSRFGKDASRSDEAAFSGRYSCKTTSEEPFGMGIILKDVPRGSFIIAEVYQKGGNPETGLVISDPEGNTYERGGIDFDYKQDWRKIILHFSVTKDEEELRVYTMHDGKGVSYFDDMKITLYPHRPVGGDSLPKMHLTLQAEDFATIENYARSARKMNIITDNFKKNVKARISFKGESHKAKVRLKGDWADHARYHKWSFRVNIKGSKTVDGVEVFSLQNPNTRWFFMEWIGHEVWRKEGIVSPRYQFVQLIVNGKNWGIYAMEEHFTKLLVEDMQRREGPLLRFDESGLWERREYIINHPEVKSLPLPAFESVIFDMFRTGKVLEDSSLYRQFLEAQNLMAFYHSGDTDLENILDLRLWARYYAIAEIMGMHHSLVWSNQRLYYNPVTNLLEPIGYDGYTTWNPVHALFWINQTWDTEYGSIFPILLYRNKEFMAYFREEFNRLSAPDYLASVRSMAQTGWAYYEKGFTEYPYYSPDLSFIDARIDTIKQAIDAFQAKEKESYYPGLKPFDCAQPHFIPLMGMNIFRQDTTPTEQILRLRNFHPCGIRIIGYAENKAGDIYPLKSPVEIRNDVLELSVPLTADRLIYSPLNDLGTVYRKKIKPWPMPEKKSSLRTFIADADSPSSVFKVSNATVTIGPGKVQLNKSVYIPSGYTVKILPGTSVDLLNHSAIVSKSVIVANGGPRPIEIFSSDKTGMGLHLLQVSDTSRLTGVTFQDLSTFKYGNWALTGAVTFYESPVKLSGCTIKGSRGEDGLNIIRSWFDISDVLVEGCFSDGIDIDFGKGTLSKSTFTKNGNDGLDLSGSTVWATDLRLIDNGDKGISFGEASQGSVENSVFEGNFFGLASKDKSSVTITSSRFGSNKVALTAFQKKWEFGPSEIDLKNCTIQNNDESFAVDKKSIIHRDGKVVAVKNYLP